MCVSIRTRMKTVDAAFPEGSMRTHAYVHARARRLLAITFSGGVSGGVSGGTRDGHTHTHAHHARAYMREEIRAGTAITPQRGEGCIYDFKKKTQRLNSLK